MSNLAVRTFMDAPPTERISRPPRHPFRVDSMPFSITPLGIAPVLPAETLTSVFMESRVITSPIANSIIGWKKHYFLFYVKVTDLLNDAIRNMFVDPNNVDLAATLGIAANDQKYYTAKGGIPYLKLAVERIAQTWFRDAGETLASTPTIFGYPAAQVKEQLFLDSLTDKDLVPQGGAIASATAAGDLERLMIAFEHLRAMGMQKMDYEDFLASYGINIPDKDLARPELLWSTSDFQYPSNTINPADGTPSAALSMVFKEGTTKRQPKRFTEPGFLIPLTITRPKIYFGGLAGNAAAHMGRAWDWMPALLREMPEASLKQFAPGTGPLGERTTATDSYFLDMRDILVHGDQFQNVVPFSANLTDNGANHIMGIPTSSLGNKYLTEAQVKFFFRDPATAGRQLVSEDGYLSFTIKGMEKDFTRGNIALA